MATPAATSSPLRALERSAKPYLRGCSSRRRWSGSHSASCASAPLTWTSSAAPEAVRGRAPGRGRGECSAGAREDVGGIVGQEHDGWRGRCGAGAVR